MTMRQEVRKIALYKRVNGFTGPIARTRHHWLTRFLARLLARYIWLKNGGRRQHTLAAIAEEWRRMFGLDRFWRIEKIEDEIVYAEIHFPCSLERSGDVAACHRLMEYDRALLDKIGGELTVLHSRADPGVTGCCKVAIRKHGARPRNLPLPHPAR